MEQRVEQHRRVGRRRGRSGRGSSSAGQWGSWAEELRPDDETQCRPCPSAYPGWPGLGPFRRPSTARKRMVLTQSSSSLSLAPLFRLVRLFGGGQWTAAVVAGAGYGWRRTDRPMRPPQVRARRMAAGGAAAGTAFRASARGPQLARGLDYTHRQIPTNERALEASCQVDVAVDPSGQPSKAHRCGSLQKFLDCRAHAPRSGRRSFAALPDEYGASQGAGAGRPRRCLSTCSTHLTEQAAKVKGEPVDQFARRGPAAKPPATPSKGHPTRFLCHGSMTPPALMGKGPRRCGTVALQPRRDEDREPDRPRRHDPHPLKLPLAGPPAARASPVGSSGLAELTGREEHRRAADASAYTKGGRRICEWVVKWTVVNH